MARFESRGGSAAVATCPENSETVPTPRSLPFDRSLIQDRCRNNESRGKTARKFAGRRASPLRSFRLAPCNGLLHTRTYFSLSLRPARHHPESPVDRKRERLSLDRFRLARPCRFYPSRKTPKKYYTLPHEVLLFNDVFLLLRQWVNLWRPHLDARADRADDDDEFVIRNRTRSLLRVLGVTDHLVGFPLDAAIFRLLLLLLMTDGGRTLLLLLLVLLIVQRRRALRHHLRLLIHALVLLQGRLIRRPRGPLVSVVTEFSWLLIALLVDDMLSQSEAQGARVSRVQPEGLF